jgi:sterol 3beta-glucosyltransferase
MALNDPSGLTGHTHQSPQEAAAAASVINNLERMEGSRRSSDDSTRSIQSRNSLDPDMAAMLNERVTAEESTAKAEEGAEIARITSSDEDERKRMEAQFQHMSVSGEEAADSDPAKSNTDAALKEAEYGQQVEVEDRMQQNQGEKQMLRREQLSQRLQEVFGLDEKEEVLEEMRCWLLRSVSELAATRVGTGIS